MALTSADRSVNIASGSINFLLHTTIILIVLLHRKLRQKRSNQLLINLSLAHALSGLFLSVRLRVLIIPFYAYEFLALIMLSVDRCFMICWPFRYNTMPKAFHVFLMAFSPAVATATFVRTVLKEDPEPRKDIALNKIVMFTGIILSVILLISNALVFKTLRKQRRAIRSLHTSTNRQLPSNNDAFSRRRQIQAFYICFGCAITFIIFWLPAMLIKALQYYFGLKMSFSYFRFALGFAGLNPISDALIFTWFNVEFKKKLKCIKDRMCNRTE